MTANNSRLPFFLLAAFMAALAVSAIKPHDYFTWALEVFPAVIGAVVLSATYKRFRFTTLVYTLIFAHALILLIGGHYTYAEEPFFSFLRDRFGLMRNNFDKVGHFAQGFVPALIIREVLVRNRVLARGKWLFVIVACMCLAISALYELLEWQVAVHTGTAADAFLGTQNYEWDTQSDMAFCLLGALVSLFTLSRTQDRQIERL